MQRFKATYLPLVLVLVGGILFGSWAVNAWAGSLNVSRLATLNPAVSGTLAGCVGSSNGGATLSLGGRVMTPSTILRIASGGACDASESGANLFGYANTVLVSAGSDVLANGQALQKAMQTVSTVATATRTFLVKLEPGIYDLGTAPLFMLPYVDLEGSGEGVTIITSKSRSNSYSTLVGAKNSELRFLTVESIGLDATFFNVGIITVPGIDKTFKVHDVTVNVSGPGLNSSAIFVLQSSPTIRNCTVNADGSVNNIYGFNTAGSTTKIENCTINVKSVGNTSAAAVYTDQTSNLTLQNLNIAVSTTNVLTSTGVFLNSAASGATIRNTNISIQASGNINAGPAVLTLGPANIQNSLFNAQAAGGGVGVQLLSGGGQLQLDSSVINTNGVAVFTGNNTPASIGASQLNGLAPTTGNTVPRCIASYRSLSGVYNALSSTCA